MRMIGFVYDEPKDPNVKLTRNYLKNSNTETKRYSKVATSPEYYEIFALDGKSNDPADLLECLIIFFLFVDYPEDQSSWTYLPFCCKVLTYSVALFLDIALWIEITSMTYKETTDNKYQII